jgi:chromosome segregation ATPase
LPADVEDALLLVAFIEGHQFKVFRAKQHLSDCASQVELITQKEASRSQKEASRSRANDIKARVETLENFCSIIVSEIDLLKARRAELRKELEAITLALAEEVKRMEPLPNAIEKMKADMKTSIREAIRLLKLIKQFQDLLKMTRGRLTRWTKSSYMRLMQSGVSLDCCNKLVPAYSSVI